MFFDQSLFEAIHGLAGKSELFDFLAVFFAEYLPYFLIVSFLLSLLAVPNWRARFHRFALGSLSVILARGLVAELIRLVYYRPRPDFVLTIEPLIDTPATSSFPSGHASVFFALGTAIFFVNKRLGTWFIIGAAIISVARVVAGVHWPFDILFGAAVGVFSAYAVMRFLPEPLNKS